MIAANYPAFKNQWKLVREQYDRPPLSDTATCMVFAALGEYDLTDVMRAIGLHQKDPDGGRYCPTAAHIIAHIAPPLTAEQRERGALGGAYETAYVLPTMAISSEEQRESMQRAGRMVREAVANVRDMPGAGPPPREAFAALKPGESVVRTRADGAIEFRCADGSWRA